jgi:hypothetical protein
MIVTSALPGARSDTVTAWLSSDNAYGPRNAPALRPVRSRTSVGLHKSMSEHMLAASDFAASLKTVASQPRMPMPSRMPCDRSFIISTPSGAAGGAMMAGGQMGAMLDAASIISGITSSTGYP